MARKRSRARRFYSRAKHSRRRSSIGGLGSLSPLIGGLGAGLALSFLSPYINRYVPSIGPASSTAIGAIAIGAGTKMLLKKDPMKIPTSLMILGGALVGTQLLSGSSGSTVGATAYANDM